ncbi:penicillin-binding transpeptidase domain-containing protein [Candidatus Epulonipiscium viviparus]|uniref:penicillin-binding transpeptidase domain-containing protein n=1 Tax=Candidatus Epulonipiscium viviparus TaxID=420336 RepID=UPI000495EE92|nr:penicillin-binding transpeptidase domain-containing protein [Candidatus Epulopiscium viviparus]
MKKLIKLLSDRLIIMMTGIIVLFLAILLRFYKLQIIDSDRYVNKVQASVERTVEVEATRGLIYDRYGKVLASNEPIHVIKIDLQVRQTQAELNDVILELLKLLRKNGDTFIDNMPISKEAPFNYTSSFWAINRFMYSIPYNGEAQRQELLKKSATEIIEYLKDEYNISDEISDADARDIIAIRTTMYPYSYRQYNSPIVATNVSELSAAYITENYTQYPGVITEFNAKRVYEYGEIIGNIIGYTRTMTDSLYKELKDKGYNEDDVVGHEGIEKSMEEVLRGTNGTSLIEVDTLGRKVNTISESTAIKGNDIFLTIDIDLQQQVFDSIEKRLSEALIVRLEGAKKGVKDISSREMLISMIESSQLLVNKMEIAPKDSMSRKIYETLLNEYINLNSLVQEEMTLQDLLLQWVTDGNSPITDKQIILAMHEQGSLYLTKKTIDDIWQNPRGDGKDILIEQLKNGYLKPSQMAIDPFSAAAAVVDVNTGEVLAMVGYPSVDSSELTNDFNNYYNTLLDDRSMLWNRSIMTVKAPGSIFKMVTAAAGLEEEVITPHDHINCTGLYTKSGDPAPACWIYPITGGGHGEVDLQKALEVSCNYYFFEVAHRLGIKYKETYGGIDSLTQYAEMFGLSKPTGIELPEKAPNISTPETVVSQSISNVLQGLKNMSEESLNRKVEDVASMLKKDLFTDDFYHLDDIENEALYLARYQTDRNMEPIVISTMGEQINEIVETAFYSIQGYLQLNIDNMLNVIIEDTMNNVESMTLKTKAKKALKNQLLTMIGDITLNAIDTNTMDIEINSIIEVYQDAYAELYEDELDKNKNPELINFLYNELVNIESLGNKYKEIVKEQIGYGLVDNLGDYLLQNTNIQWDEGVTIRTAIGQGYNAFSPIQMARYVAAVANGENVYDLKIVGGVFDNKQTQKYLTTANKISGTLDIKDEHIQEIQKGMLRVTQGSSGTSRMLFNGFPIDVAGKTGTAEEANHTHSWFAGFAPADNPQIVVVTSVYNEDNLGSFGSQIAKDVFASYFKVDESENLDTLGDEFLY